MRMRTTLAAGALAVAAILGSTGTALADGYDNHHSGGGSGACGEFAAAIHGNAAWGNGCKHSQWQGMMPGHGHQGGFNSF